MVRTSHRLLFVLLVSSLQVQTLLAQPPDVPFQPVPVVPPPQPEPLPPIAVPPSNQAPFGQVPPPPGSNPFVPGTPLFVQQDPLAPAVQPGLPVFNQSGCYGLFEISLLFPDLHGFLSGPVTIAGVPQTVQIGSASLDGTGSPKLEVGYRLGDGMGAVAGTYRSIVSHGGGNIPAFDALGTGFLSSMLNFNVVDLDYVSPDYSLAPQWDFAWRGGVRFAAAYFENQVIGSFVREQATSNFIGAGPHGTLELGYLLPVIPGLAVLAQLDGAVLFGNMSQSFDETLHFPGGAAIGDTTRFNHTQTVPVLTFDLGLSYTPPGLPNWARFGFGYQFEYWWNVGTSGGSRNNLETNGVYFRGEFNF